MMLRATKMSFANVIIAATCQEEFKRAALGSQFAGL